MTNIADIQPDVELKKVLDGAILIYTSSNSFNKVHIYSQAERPDIELNAEFIDIAINGTITAVAKNPLGIFTGNLAINIYCKTGSKGRVKRNRIRDIIAQVEKEVKCRKSGKYFFDIDPSNVIQQPTPDSSGYSVASINVRWRMNEDG